MQQELEYIYEIYKSGSFSKAAENLYITQPALSMAVKKIEESIGMSLFDRSTRPLSLTEAGKIYMASIDRFVALEEELNSQIHDINELRSGSLTIGGSHYINAYILPDIMTKFNLMYPGIKLDLIEASSAVLADMLNERMIDLTFSCDEKLISDFQGFIPPAFNDNILLAVSKDIFYHKNALSAKDILRDKHLKADCPSIPFEEMNRLKYIILSEGNNLHNRAMRIFSEAGIKEPKIKIEISQLATSYHLARAKFGAAFISDKLIKTAAEVSKSNLNFYRINSKTTQRLFYSVLPKRNYTSKAVKAFIKLLR